jgi:hypothetical protein
MASVKIPAVEFFYCSHKIFTVGLFHRTEDLLK